MPSKSLVWGEKSNIVQMLCIFILLSSTEGRIADINSSLQNNKHQVH